MSLGIAPRELVIRLAVPIRTCDGCRAINETAIGTLRRTTDGGYTADPELPKGWNTLAVGAHSVDLCDRCSAAAVLERRQAAKPTEAAIPTAPTIVDAILGPEDPPPGGIDGKNQQPTAAKEA